MNLLDLRKQFREVSGRYDLVNDDGSDNGANFYINEASKWLDRTIETTKSWASFMVILTAGSWAIRFPFARAVKEVWATTSNGRCQLEKLRMQDLIASFYRKIPADWINGVPKYYSPTITRYIPEDVSAATLATFAAYVGVLDNNDYDYNAVVISAPIEQDTLFEIIGLFYSRLLVEDDEENYWSRVNPLLLIQVAIRQTCIVSGNKPLMDSLDRGIDGDLTRLDKDLTEQIIAEIDQMEG